MRHRIRSKSVVIGLVVGCLLIWMGVSAPSVKAIGLDDIIVPTTVPSIPLPSETNSPDDQNGGGTNGGVGTTPQTSQGGDVSGDIPTIIPSQPTGVPDSVEAIVKRLFDFGITVGGIIFMLMFLYGGINYLASSAEPEQAKKAKDTMIHATIGLVLVLGAWTIARFIGHELGYPGF